jgi:hypothetical protein
MAASVMSTAPAVTPACHGAAPQAAVDNTASCCCRIAALPSADTSTVFAPVPAFSSWVVPRLILSDSLIGAHDLATPHSFYVARGRYGPPFPHNDTLAILMTFVI